MVKSQPQLFLSYLFTVFPWQARRTDQGVKETERKRNPVSCAARARREVFDSSRFHFEEKPAEAGKAGIRVEKMKHCGGEMGFADGSGREKNEILKGGYGWFIDEVGGGGFGIKGVGFGQ